MATKAQTSPKKPPREQAVEAALALAAQRSWTDITLAQIARKAGLTLAQLADLFEDKSDILSAYGRLVDHQVLEAMGQGTVGDDVHERLFDILMERFDRLNDHRTAMVSILNSFCTEPKEWVIAFPHLGRSMAWMAEAAGLDITGVKGAIRLTGLSVVYLAALRVWKDDDSADMAKTMAALDRYLGRAGQCVQTFGL